MSWNQVGPFRDFHSQMPARNIPANNALEKILDDNFRVKAPSEQEIENVLEKVSTQEMIELSTNQQSQIVKSKLPSLIPNPYILLAFSVRTKSKKSNAAC